MYVTYASVPSGEIAIAGKSGRSLAGEAIPRARLAVERQLADRVDDAGRVDVRDDLSRPDEALAAVERADHEDGERLRLRVDAVRGRVDDDRLREAADLLAPEGRVADVDVAEERAGRRRIVDCDHLVVREERRVLLGHDHRRLPGRVHAGLRRRVVLAVEPRHGDRL